MTSRTSIDQETNGISIARSSNDGAADGSRVVSLTMKNKTQTQERNNNVSHTMLLSSPSSSFSLQQRQQPQSVTHPNSTMTTTTTSTAQESPMLPGEKGNTPPGTTAPHIYKFIPSFFRFDNAPTTDATGLSLDFYARAGLVMSTVFLGPALLRLASQAAGCVDAQGEVVVEDSMAGGGLCENRVSFWGFIRIKPSSLLTNIAVLSGAIAALTMPLVGAIVDHTPYRRGVGIWTALGLTICMGVNAMVSINTWMIVATVQTFGFFLYNAHIVVTYAYTSEISKDPVVQTKYNSHYFVVLYVSILMFMTTVILFAYAFRADDVGTARISQAVAFICSAIFFGIPWTFLFTKRPASTVLPRGKNLLTAGFTKLWQTSRHISTNIPQLRWLMWSIMCSEAATATLVSIATTYMVHFLGMDIIAVGTTYALILIMGIPGAKFGEWLALRASPRASALSALIFFIFTTLLAAIVLEGPEHAPFMKIFGILWGTGLGWLHPSNTTMFITLTPTHSQTEYMGIYNFSQSVIGWLPPLVFTILNERGFPMNVGLASINYFFFMAFLFLLFMGPIDLSGDKQKCLDHAHKETVNEGGEDTLGSDVEKLNA